jgi:hypothetical protein
MPSARLKPRVARNSHPYGSTTATEEVWSDDLVTAAMEYHGLSTEEFEEKTVSEQSALIRQYENQLGETEEEEDDDY